MELSKAVNSQWLRHCALAACGYFLLAMVCVAIATWSPEINIPIWAPAGFAFAAMLMWSYRCWPGIWLGAWLAHGALSGSPALGPSDLLLPTAATLQAALGVWLVHRATRTLGKHPGARQFALWLACAAPIPCALFSPVGIVIAGDFSEFSPELISTAMLGWWSGSTLGVILIGPAIVFAWPGQRLQQRAIAKPMLLTVAITAVAICAAHYWLSIVHAQSQYSLTREKLTHILPSPQEMKQAWFQQLAVIEHFLGSSELVTKDELQSFSQALRGRSALSYIDIVGRSASLDSTQELSAYTLSDDGKLLPLQGPARYPVVMSVPISPSARQRDSHEALSEQIVGLDHWSRPSRREAMQKAAADGRTHVAMDVVYRFKNDARSGSESGFFAFLPLKVEGEPSGYVVGVYTLGDFFKPLADAAERENVHLRVFDVGASDTPLYTSDKAPEYWHPKTVLESQFHLDDLNWRVQAMPTDFTPFDRDDRFRQALLLMSVVIAYMTTFAVLIASGENLRLRSEVRRKTLELRKNLTELREAKNAAESANQAKSMFLATVSHEIRTPMNGVLGMVDVIKSTTLSRHQRDMLDTVERSGKLLLDLIDDILDFSKIEAQRLELHQSLFDPSQMVQGVVDSLTETAYRKNVTIQVQCADAAARTIAGDETRIRQILFNLIGNAVKFSQKQDSKRGRVTVRYEVVEAAKPRLEIAVIDNGIGMTTEAQTRVFNPFTQAETSTTRRFGGTGLGLAISKRLVDLMEGQISFQSQPGKGTRFQVSIPTHIEQTDRRSENVFRWQQAIILTSDEVPVTALQSWCAQAGLTSEVHDTLESAAARLTVSREALLVFDCGTDEPDLQQLRQVLPSGRLPQCIVITRGRRRQPYRHRSGLITLDQLTRSAFLEALHMLDQQTGEFCPLSTNYATQPEEPDVTLDSLDNLYCLLIGKQHGALAEVAQILRDRKMEAVIAPSWEDAELTLQGDPRKVIVIEDIGDKPLSLDSLRDRYHPYNQVKTLNITRGRRQAPRYEMQDAITLDLETLNAETLTEGVLLASSLLNDRGGHVGQRIAQSEFIQPSVLVVEDDATNRRVIEAQLNQLGITAHYAEDGLSGLQQWLESRHLLVITDIHMPEMDGYEMVRQIREQAPDNTAPHIIALSANAAKDEKYRARAHGVDIYLLKPTSGQQLRESIASLAPTLLPHPPNRAPHPAQLGSSAEIDFATQRSVLGEDRGLTAELIGDYLTASGQQVEELVDALQHAQRDHAAELAHILKSASRSLGALHLGELLQLIEEQAEHMDTLELVETATQLRTHHRRVSEALQEQLHTLSN